MEQLTKDVVSFGNCGMGHLYKGLYAGGNIAIFAGKAGEIGKLSVNLNGTEASLKITSTNEFYVYLYGTGDIMNKPCLDTGLFEIIDEPFKFNHGMFQKWALK